jgi:RHS repeat-associated protein
VSSSAGALVNSIKYLPFGATRSGDLPTDKKFTGQRLDGTGLYYYNARYYDPTIGRFISPDTVVPNVLNPQAFNRYSYVVNNPLKYVDPSGHWTFCIGLSFTVNILFASFEYSYGVAFDGRRNVVQYRSVGGGAGLDVVQQQRQVSAAFGVSFGSTTAQSVYQLAGPETREGVQVFIGGLGGSYETIQGKDYVGSETTIGIGIGGGVYGKESQTELIATSPGLPLKEAAPVSTAPPSPASPPNTVSQVNSPPVYAPPRVEAYSPPAYEPPPGVSANDYYQWLYDAAAMGMI